MKCVLISGTDIILICEMLTGQARPYVPSKLRKLIYQRLHNLSIKATQQFVAQCFVSAGMNHNMGIWTEAAFRVKE